MNKFTVVLVTLACIQVMVGTVLAAPTVDVVSTKQSVEKGDIFQIRVKISTTEPINSVVIVPIAPEGFVVEPIPSMGIETGKGKTEIRIDRLEAGSELTASFTVKPPTLLGNMTSTTEELKSFVFNVLYNEYKRNSTDPANVLQEVQASQTKTISIRYTTDMSVYLIWGVVGILLGHIIKISTKDRDKIEPRLKKEDSFMKTLLKNLSEAFQYIFLVRILALLTILAIGFGALIVLAKESLPINTWDQALALGMGLAILTDEQLLSKIKP